MSWEATVLTARQGPQMIGFSFVHTSPLALPVLVSALLAQVWLLIGVPWAAYMLWRRQQLRMVAWVLLGAIATPIIIVYLIAAVTGRGGE